MSYAIKVPNLLKAILLREAFEAGVYLITHVIAFFLTIAIKEEYAVILI
jgi:hypothetical protein